MRKTVPDDIADDIGWIREQLHGMERRLGLPTPAPPDPPEALPAELAVLRHRMAVVKRANEIRTPKKGTP